MPLQRTYYEILGVSPTATPEEIKKKYRELARKYHPDLVADKALGQKVFAQINMAYRMVGDADRRRQYDSTLNSDGAVATQSRSNSVGPGSSRASGVMPTAATATATATATAGRAAATADPDTIDRLLGNADTALLRAEAERANVICNNILKMDPRCARAYATMGDAYMQLKQYAEAEAAYRKSLEILPSSLIRNKLSQLRMLMASVKSATADDAPAQKPGAKKPEEPERRGLFGRLLKPKKP
jgi:curved DNA-binding protein CbpA